MVGKRRLPATVLLNRALAATVIFAGCAARNTKMYDSTHDDWHSWDNNESRAYQRYWEETGQPYRRYGALNQEQEKEYWKWRHDHADAAVAGAAKEQKGEALRRD